MIRIYPDINDYILYINFYRRKYMTINYRGVMSPYSSSTTPSKAWPLRASGLSAPKRVIRLPPWIWNVQLSLVGRLGLYRPSKGFQHLPSHNLRLIPERGNISIPAILLQHRLPNAATGHEKAQT